MNLYNWKEYLPPIKDQLLIGFSLIVLLGIYSFPKLFFYLPIMWPLLIAIPIIGIQIKQRIKTRYQFVVILSWFIINFIIFYTSPINLISLNWNRFNYPPEGAPVMPGSVILKGSNSSWSSSSVKSVCSLATSLTVLPVFSASLAIFAEAS